MDSIKNLNNHSYLIEEIRKRLSILEKSNWTVTFSWVKAQTGILGNELADQLAKAAAGVKDKIIVYSRIPMGTLYRNLEEETKLKYQKTSEESSLAALKNSSFQAYQTDSIRR